MSDEQLTTYERLAARFDTHATRKQGGTELIYLTGEQVITRMNEVLGPTGWSFRVVSQGTTDMEAWVLGELVATIDGVAVLRQQYGNQDLARGQHSTTDLFKAACTDAIKKAATTIGVGLYLYDADERRAVQAEMRGNQGQPASQPNTPTPMRQNGGSALAANMDTEQLICEDCNEQLTETRFKDGTNWAPSQLAVFGRRKHSRILCMSCYREANNAKRRAEEALQQVPF